jgi:RNA-directed DNA polymerase
MIAISNIKHLCYVLGADINTIENIISNIDVYYHTWEKVKHDKETGKPILKDGVPKIRILNTTKPKLKRIQKRLYKFLLIHSDLPEYAYGGIPKRDNVLNAKQHQGNKFIFTTDLKSFFPTISNSDVFNFFNQQGCTPTVSRILTKLTTYKHQLPQGVPTSTLLANLIFKKTGDKLNSFSYQRNILFTSFVDDLTFSSKTCFKHEIPKIIEIIKDDGYSISHNKTFYKTKNPVITGIVCQNNRLKLRGTYYKRLSRIRKQSVNKPEDLSLQKTEEGLFRYRRKVGKSVKN